MITKRDAVIGIGISDDPERVFSGIGQYSGPCTVRCYVTPAVVVPDYFSGTITCSEKPEEALIQDLHAGVIQAGVRGSLPSDRTIRRIKDTFCVSEIERVVLLETAAGDRFFLAPVGIDEGWTIKQKLSLIEKGRAICRKFGLSDRVTVLSGGRITDVGRHQVVDRTLADAELISRLTGADHLGILIEDAVKKSGLIIAPDGISGNLIFRTLIFLGNGRSHGAPVLNISKIFVDTSRVNPDYHYALILAGTMID
ncbi:MAG: methanogenesis marker protein Mmp4/MtxX [Methanospirillum sp.]|nr:methanogenesis marker protein Mmp4/MtxX [Methanospirillum sp.]